MPWKPTTDMQSNARRALKWRSKGFKGGTSTGLSRARQLASRRDLSAKDIIDMNAWFARHSKSKSENEKRSNANPSKWWVAWNLWGGDSAKRFVESRVDKAREERGASAFSALDDIDSDQWLVNATEAKKFITLASSKTEAIDSVDEGTRAQPAYAIHQGVAIHRVTGPLFSEPNAVTRLLHLPDYETLSVSIKAADESPSVKAHLFLMDSPGGHIVGIDDISATVKALKKRKWTYVRGMACSAAYWLASGTDRIVAAQSGTRIGCLGTRATLITPMTVEGVESVVSPQTPGKVGSRTQTEAMLSDYADIMLSSIADARGMTVDAVLAATAIAEGEEGGTVSATRALDGGLIDAIGTLDATIAEMSAQFGGSALNFNVGISSSAVHDAVIQASTSSEGVRFPRVVTVTEDEPQITTAPPQVHETTEANTMADSANHHGDVVAKAEFDSAQARIAELEAALKGATATIEGETVTAAALASQVQAIQAEKADLEAQAKTAAEEAEALKAEAFNSKVSAALEAAHKEGKLAAGEKEHLQACADEDAEVFGRDRAFARLERALSVKAVVVPVGAPAGHDAPAPGASLKTRAQARAEADGITYAEAAKIERRLIAEGK